MLLGLLSTIIVSALTNKYLPTRFEYFNAEHRMMEEAEIGELESSLGNKKERQSEILSLSIKIQLRLSCKTLVGEGYCVRNN